MKIRPLTGYVLLQIAEAEKMTDSGLYLPETQQAKSDKAKVIAVGDDKSPVAIDDTVMYKKWGGDDFKLSGIDYKLVKYEDLIAIVD